MEPLFWIICAYFAFVSLGVAVRYLLNVYRIHICTRKHIEQGTITKKQKKQLPEILLQKGQEALECGNLRDACYYINECMKLCKWGERTDLEQRAAVELARYYAVAGKEKQALEVLSPLYSPYAYLLRGQLLLRQDPSGNYQEIGRCSQKAMECEELKGQALELIMARETAVHPFNANQNAAEMTEEEKIQAIVDAMKQSPEWAADQEYIRRSVDRFLQKKG